jgi:general secretion pathway protein G
MKWFYNRIYRKDKGFTLVELMVVIIILAVLTGIAIPSYMALRNRARIQATRSEMQNIATAIAVYEADNDGFPVAENMAGLIDIIEPDYMLNVPLNDAWGDESLYTYVGAAGTYTLSSTGGGPIVITDGEFVGD